MKELNIYQDAQFQFKNICRLTCWASRTHVESPDKPCDVNKRSQALPGKLNIKRHSSGILYVHCLE